MANADIRQLEMDGSVFYPQTDIHGLVNNGGYAIDDEPTQGSDNLVKSGGIYPIKVDVDKLNIPEDFIDTSYTSDLWSNGYYKDDKTFVNDSDNIHTSPIELYRGDVLNYHVDKYGSVILWESESDGTLVTSKRTGWSTGGHDYTYTAPKHMYVVVVTNKYWYVSIHVVRDINRISTLEEDNAISYKNEKMVVLPSDFALSDENVANYAGYKIIIRHDFKVGSQGNILTFPDDVTLVFEGGSIRCINDSVTLTVLPRSKVLGKNLTIVADPDAENIMGGLLWPTITNKEVYLSWLGNFQDITYSENKVYSEEEIATAGNNLRWFDNASYSVINKIIYVNRNLGLASYDHLQQVVNGHEFIGIKNATMFSVGTNSIAPNFCRVKRIANLIFKNISITTSYSGYYGSSEVLTDAIPFIIENNKFLGSEHDKRCCIYAGSVFTRDDNATHIANTNRYKGSIIRNNYMVNGGGGDWRYGQSIEGDFTRGTGATAISIRGANGWIVEHNTILGNYCFGICVQTSAINTIIKNNIINGARTDEYGYKRGIVEGVTEGLIRCKDFDMIGGIKFYNPTSYHRPFYKLKDNIICNNIVTNIMDEGICFEAYFNPCCYVGTIQATKIEEREAKGNKTKYKIDILNALPQSYGEGATCERTISESRAKHLIGCDLEVVSGNSKGTITEILVNEEDEDNIFIYVECDKFSDVTTDDLIVITNSCKNNIIESNILENIRRPALYLDGSCNYNKILNNIVRYCSVGVAVYDYVSDNGKLISTNNYNEIVGNRIYDSPNVNFEPTYYNDDIVYDYSIIPIYYYGQTQVVVDSDAVRVLRVFNERNAAPKSIVINSGDKSQYTFDTSTYQHVVSGTIKAQCKSFGNVVVNNVAEGIIVSNNIKPCISNNMGEVEIAACINPYAVNANQVIRERTEYRLIDRVTNPENENETKMALVTLRYATSDYIRELTEE